MFNRGRYNLQRFNLYSMQETEIAIRELMVEVLNAMVANGENIHIYEYGSERINAAAYATAGEIYTAEMCSGVEAEVIAASQFVLEAVGLEELSGNVQASENCHIVAKLLSSVKAAVELSSDERLVVLLLEGVSAAAFASADYYAPAVSMYTAFDAIVSSSRFDITYIVLDVTIPAGGTLIIDSDSYVVLLGDENVIDKHSGAWLDELTRNTFDVQIEGNGVNELVGSILYTPRYL